MDEPDAAPPDPETWVYAVRAITVLVRMCRVPVPRMTEIQNGGVGAKWHGHGLNIELQFREPHYVDAVFEDEQNVIRKFKKNLDPGLVMSQRAVCELGRRISLARRMGYSPMTGLD